MDRLELWYPTIAIFMLSGIARLTLGSWLVPGAFFPLFWGCVITVSIPADFPIWAPCLWWMAATLLVFYLGNLLAMNARSLASEAHLLSVRKLELPGLQRVTVFAIAGSMVYIFFRQVISNADKDTPPMYFQILLSFVYSAPVFGGMLFGSSSKRSDRITSFLAFTPGLFYAVIYMGRSPMVMAIYQWAAGFWAVRIYICRGRVPILTQRTAVVATILFIVLPYAGALIYEFRKTEAGTLPISQRLALYRGVVGDVDKATLQKTFHAEAFSYPYAFGFFLEPALKKPPEPKWGIVIFHGPCTLLGISKKSDWEWDSFEVEKGIHSNVYSVFMPPIVDFGLKGSFVAWFVAGFLGGAAYRSIAQGGLLAIPILTIFYPHTMLLGGRWFVYNSIVLADVSIFLYVYWRSKARLPSVPHMSDSPGQMRTTARPAVAGSVRSGSAGSRSLR